MSLLTACELWHHHVSEFRVDPFTSPLSSKLAVLLILVVLERFFNPIMAVSFFGYLTFGYLVGVMCSEDRRSRRFIRMYIALGVSCLWMLFAVGGRHYHEQQMFSKYDYIGPMKLANIQATTTETTSWFHQSAIYETTSTLILLWGGRKDCPLRPHTNCTSFLTAPAMTCNIQTNCDTVSASECTVLLQQAEYRTLQCEKQRNPLVFTLLQAGFNPYDPSFEWPQSQTLFGDCSTCQVADMLSDPSVRSQVGGSSQYTALVYGMLFLVNLTVSAALFAKQVSPPSTEDERRQLIEP